MIKLHNSSQSASAIFIFSLSFFTFVYFCLLLFTFVYFCLLLFTTVYFHEEEPCLKREKHDLSSFEEAAQAVRGIFEKLREKKKPTKTRKYPSTHFLCSSKHYK